MLEPPHDQFRHSLHSEASPSDSQTPRPVEKPSPSLAPIPDLDDLLSPQQPTPSPSTSSAHDRVSIPQQQPSNDNKSHDAPDRMNDDRGELMESPRPHAQASHHMSSDLNALAQASLASDPVEGDRAVHELSALAQGPEPVPPSTSALGTADLSVAPRSKQIVI